MQQWRLIFLFILINVGILMIDYGGLAWPFLVPASVFLLFWIGQLQKRIFTTCTKNQST